MQDVSANDRRDGASTESITCRRADARVRHGILTRDVPWLYPLHAVSVRARPGPRGTARRLRGAHLAMSGGDRKPVEMCQEGGDVAPRASCGRYISYVTHASSYGCSRARSGYAVCKVKNPVWAKCATSPRREVTSRVTHTGEADRILISFSPSAEKSLLNPHSVTPPRISSFFLAL